jgi:predicted acetyltransferase
MPTVRLDPVWLRAGVITDVRVPAEADREQISRLLSTSLNFPVERALARAPRLPLKDFRCTYEDDRIVASAAEFHFLQWFGGRSMPMSGIFGVATLPERRRSGLMSAALRQILQEARERGDPISALFPAVLRPYRRLGYELAGTFTQHQLPVEAIPTFPAEGLPSVDLLDLERDLEGIWACYRAWAAARTGAIEPVGDRWWTSRVFDRPFDETFRAVVVRGETGIEGFAAFAREPTSGPLDVAFGMDCNPLVANTERALRALLSYFRGHHGVGRWVRWPGPPNDPITLWVQEQNVEQHDRFAWMLRLLDVQAAFEQRGYPAEDGSCTIAVDDPLFPENAGPWRIDAVGGKVAVSKTEGSPRPIPIGALSALFTGYLRPGDAVRLGLLDADDPSVDVFSRLLAGPDPWSPFLF